ncbi:MAG: M23 family metallopeptidase [Desulfovibrio sp.]
MRSLRRITSVALVLLLGVCLLSGSVFAQDAEKPMGEAQAPAVSLVDPARDGDNSTGAVEVNFELNVALPEKVDVGKPFAVRMTSSGVLRDVTIHWMGHTITPALSVWNDKHIALALLGSDVLNAKPGEQELILSADIDGIKNVIRKTVVLVGKKYKDQKLTVAKKMVTPPKSVYDKIKADRKEVKVALGTVTTERKWFLPFERPVKGITTSQYGLRRILNGKPKNPHRGLDFRAAVGTDIHAPAAGTVVLVGEHYYAGNSVYIDHGNGVVSMYFHLSKSLVKVGDKVKKGDVFGLTGKTGRITGPHLHWSVSVGGMLVDPAVLLESNVDSLLGK